MKNKTTAIPVSVEELQYFICIFTATVRSSICQRASATPFHVASLVLRSQRTNISCLQRTLSPWWFFSMVLSSKLCTPSFTPSECQSVTEFNSFERSCRVGVAGDVGENTTITSYFGDTTRSHISYLKYILHFTLLSSVTGG